MRPKYTLVARILVLFLAGISSGIVPQQRSHHCRTCLIDETDIPMSEVACVSSRFLKANTQFINKLYVRSTVALARIKDKRVFVSVLVDTTGKVVNAKATVGHPALKPVALVIAKNARFRPKQRAAAKPCTCAESWFWNGNLRTETLRRDQQRDQGHLHVTL